MKERQSNIELLRLVCMFMIVWIHFAGYSIIQCSESYVTQTGFVSVFPQLILGLCWCAVNTFILISGYFSIRPKAKSFFGLYLTCAFYAGLLYVVHMYLSDSHFNRWAIYNTLMPFGLWKSSTNWWFIPNYLILYILSPILNKIADNVSKREFQYFLVLMSIVVFYFGWYRHEVWSEAGVNFFNFVYIYFIGRYIALHTRRNKFIANGGGTLLWLLFGLTIGVIEWLCLNTQPIFSWMWQNGYNSPLCIGASICLFMTFKLINMRPSKVINYMAASALPIYLVHNCKYICEYLYVQVTRIYDSYPLWEAYLLICAVALALVILIPLLDKLRLLITNPIQRWCCNGYYAIKPKLISVFDKCQR